MRIIALVGMPGAGKSEVARIMKEKGFHLVRLGDVTFRELRERGLERNRDNEEMITKELRYQYGPEVYVEKSLHEIEKYENVVVDGIRNIDEFMLLRKKYGHNAVLVSVEASDEIRHERLLNRGERSQDKELSMRRDKHEEEIGVRRSMGNAQYKLNNEKSKEELILDVEKLIKSL